MRTAVLRGVGVPVTVTCAPTRTLAKILSHWAKHTPATGGVAVWDGLPAGLTEEIMAATPVGEVWGVGRLLEPKLMGLNATTALRLRGMDPAFVRRRFGERRNRQTVRPAQQSTVRSVAPRIPHCRRSAPRHGDDYGVAMSRIRRRLARRPLAMPT